MENPKKIRRMPPLEPHGTLEDIPYRLAGSTFSVKLGGHWVRIAASYPPRQLARAVHDFIHAIAHSPGLQASLLADHKADGTCRCPPPPTPVEQEPPDAFPVPAPGAYTPPTTV